MAKHRKPLAVSRFDIILAFILTFAVAVIACDAWMVVNGFEQLSPSVWTFAGTLTGGEIIAFSLYQIAKEVRWSKDERQKVLAGKHEYIKQLEEESHGEAEK